MQQHKQCRSFKWINVTKKTAMQPVIPICIQTVTIIFTTKLSRIDLDPSAHLCMWKAQFLHVFLLNCSATVTSMTTFGLDGSGINIILPIYNWSLLSVRLVSGINFLVLSVNHISAPLSLPFLFMLLYHFFSLCQLTTLTIHNSPSLFHSRLKTYIFYKSFPP